MKGKGLSLAYSIRARALDLIRERDLLGGRKLLLVAVSGGQDSVCLLGVLANLQQTLDIKLHIAHLDHGLRGTESEGDARYVSRLAKRLGLPATIEKRDVQSFRKRRKLSLEEAAREVRYAFFADVAGAIGTDRVAVAHTNNDLVETVLMHLIRGSGIRGLQGLQPVNRWQSGEKSLTVVRPLIGISRQDTGEYCRTLRLRPRTDSSNLSLTTFRNRVRLELLPLLEKYNPRIAEALQRTSVQASETAEFIEQQCRGLWDKIVRREDGAFVLDKVGFTGIPPALQRNLVLNVLQELRGNLTDIESRHIDEITATMNLPAGRSINLPGGLIFAVDYDKILFTRGAVELSPLPPLEGETKLEIPGETRLPGWLVSASIEGGPELAPYLIRGAPPCPDELKSAPVRQSGAGGLKNKDFIAYLDLNKTGRELAVRSLKIGDCFQPLGMNETKKVARLMSDARIPRSWRVRVPIIVSPSQIVWVAGYRIDDRVKITEGTRDSLRLEFKRTG